MSGHVWYEAFTPAGVMQSGPAGILVVAFWVYAVFLISHDLVVYCVKKCCSGLKLTLDEINVDELIDDY